MAVLVEATSVIVRIDILEEKYPGGFEDYKRDCPNSTFCADEYLTRVGFMNPRDVKIFVDQLEEYGLLPDDGEKFVDLAVADQLNGPNAPCDWLGFAWVPDGPACTFLIGTHPGNIAVPNGWDFENSLSKTPAFIRTDDADEKIKYVEEVSTGVRSFVDTNTGQKLYSGSPFSKKLN